jgi:hypothetical protein
MLALTFVDPADYDKVQPNDKVDIVGLYTFTPGKNLTLVAKHEDGTKDVRILNYSSILVFDADFAVSTGTPLGPHLQRRPDRMVQGWLCP